MGEYFYGTQRGWWGFLRGTPAPPFVRLDPEPVEPPTVEPISVDEAKLHARIDGDAEDTLLDLIIKGQRQQVETELGKALITQTLSATLHNFPADRDIYLPRPPLQSVVHVKYIDRTGSEITLPPGDYEVDTGGVRGRIYLPADKYWPDHRYEPGAVRIQFIAGYGAAATDVPEKYRLRILTACANYYADREGMSTRVSPHAAAATRSDRVGF